MALSNTRANFSQLCENAGEWQAGAERADTHQAGRASPALRFTATQVSDPTCRYSIVPIYGRYFEPNNIAEQAQLCDSVRTKQAGPRLMAKTGVLQGDGTFPGHYVPR